MPPNKSGRGEGQSAVNINSTFALTSSAPPTGIDKLSLTTRDFTVVNSKRSGLTVQPAPQSLATGEANNSTLFRDKSGREVSGMKAYLNEELFSVNINQHGLNVILNPSKPYHPTELCRDEETFHNRLQTVYRALRERGIKADYGQMKVSRIDLARNGQMKNPCTAYHSIFSGLGISRAKRQAAYPDGYTTGNNTFGLTFYNKGREAETGQDNLLRGELQFKRSDGKLYRLLSIGRADDIAEVGFSHLNDNYREIMQGHVFRTDSYANQQTIVFADSLQQLNTIIETVGKQRSLIYFERLHGVESLLQATGGIEGYRKLLKQAGFHRNIVRKRVNELHRNLSMFSRMKESRTLGKLYRELHRTFAA